MMKKSKTKELAKKISKIEFDDLTNETIYETKRLILDTIGCAFGGYLTDIGRITNNLADELGGKPDSTIIGSGKKTSVTNAAFINAKNSNALDYDDVFYNVTHFAGPSIFPAIAMGEKSEKVKSGRDLILSTALAYDISARFVLSAEHVYKLTGEWPNYDLECLIIGTQTYSVFGAATGATKILGLDESKISNAWGIASAAAPICHRDREERGTKMTKYQDMGFNSEIGTKSALLSKIGYTGPSTVFNRDGGIFPTLGMDNFNFDTFLGDIGEKWYIEESSKKLYPACRWNSSSIDLLKSIVEENNLSSEDIEEVIVHGHPMLVRTKQNSYPESPIDATYSLPYQLALAAYNIEPGPKWQSPRMISNKEIKKFSKKVKTELDRESCEAFDGVPAKKIPVKVKVISGNESYIKKSEYALGDPWKEETVLGDSELEEKFKRNSYCLHEASELWENEVDRIIDLLWDLENLEDINNLTRELSQSL